MKYSMRQLIEKNVAVLEDPDYDDTFYILNPERDYFVEYGEGSELVDGFSIDANRQSVLFCTPCGIEHVNEFEAKLDEKAFEVFRKEAVKL